MVVCGRKLRIGDYDSDRARQDPRQSGKDVGAAVSMELHFLFLLPARCVLRDAAGSG